MRRLLAVVAVLFLSACSDRHAQGPFGPFGAPQYSSVDGKNATFVLEGETWTVNGVECKFGNEGGQDGVRCGTEFLPWTGDLNTGLYPVVEICRFDRATNDCVANPTDKDTASFFRKSGIEVDDEGKYVLSLKNQGWWDRAGDGEYRIIVAITYTGIRDAEKKDFTPVPGWDIKSEKVLGYFNHVRQQGESEKRVRFLIAPGALCEVEACVETAFAPEDGYILILDTEFNETDEQSGVVAIKFPADAKYSTDQTQINVIFERIKRADLDANNEKCLVDEGVFKLLKPGTEVEDCYRVRTEPFIQLDPALSPRIEFVICTNLPRSRLRMVKYSYAKKELTDPVPEAPDSDLLRDCLGLASADHASTRHLAGFGGIRSRLKAAAASVLMPAPLHARRRSSRLAGGMLDLSAITLVQTDEYKVNFVAPINQGSIDESYRVYDPVPGEFVVAVCKRSDNTVPCAAPADLPDLLTGPLVAWGEAAWTNDVYQFNWRTPRTESTGEYDAVVYKDKKLLTGFGHFSIRGSGSGEADYTHNPGRTLPMKFFLSAQ
jgi:hypothetical protein